MKRYIAIAALTLLVAACGGSSGSDFPDDVPTGSPPIVARVDPAAGPVGTAITIFGIGFSLAPPNNIVMIGNASTAATDYQLLSPPAANEVESISAVIPTDTAVGINSILVVVDGNPSNGDILFTVTP